MLVFAILLSALTLSAVAKPENYPFDKTTITAPDDSVTATFISLGATMTELWVKDRTGKKLDVVLGYDDDTMLLSDPTHPYFNPIVGRYANRIKNGTFSIPITKEPQPPGPDVYQIPTNEHNGKPPELAHSLHLNSRIYCIGSVTLHGGVTGWDRKNWTIADCSDDSVTYKHVDEADQGFPGDVTAFVTFTAVKGGKLRIKMRAEATELTPIMLTQHTYWNLDGFEDKVANSTVIPTHHLRLAADKVIAIDGYSIPTGEYIDVEGTPFDLRKDSGPFANTFNTTVDLCGKGCQGYDHCWVFTKPKSKTSKATLWSEKTGIKLDVFTDQPAMQVYTGGNFKEIPRKAVHGGPGLNYTKFSSVVLEQQGQIDAINTPEWNVDQIYGPDRPFEFHSTYKFSTVKD